MSEPIRSLNGINVAASDYVKDGTVYVLGDGPVVGSVNNVVSAWQGAARALDLTDVDKALAQAARLKTRAEPPQDSLVARLASMSDYGTFEFVRIVKPNGDFDYVLECQTGRGKMRIEREAPETWEQCLVRRGLLDA